MSPLGCFFSCPLTCKSSPSDGDGSRVEGDGCQDDWDDQGVGQEADGVTQGTGDGCGVDPYERGHGLQGEVGALPGEDGDHAGQGGVQGRGVHPRRDGQQPREHRHQGVGSSIGGASSSSSSSDRGGRVATTQQTKAKQATCRAGTGQAQEGEQQQQASHGQEWPGGLARAGSYSTGLWVQVWNKVAGEVDKNGWQNGAVSKKVTAKSNTRLIYRKSAFKKTLLETIM